jgi:hypothetical protein
MNHRNILPFYGYATDEWFRPLAALVSPVRWFVFSIQQRIYLNNFSGVLMGMLVDIWEKMASGWSWRSVLIWYVGETLMH